MDQVNGLPQQYILPSICELNSLPAIKTDKRMNSFLLPSCKINDKLCNGGRIILMQYCSLYCKACNESALEEKLIWKLFVVMRYSLTTLQNVVHNTKRSALMIFVLRSCIHCLSWWLQAKWIHCTIANAFYFY